MSAPSPKIRPPIREFLSNHEQALGHLLGIEITEMRERNVIATLQLGPEHLTSAGAVQGGVVMAIADIAGALGAVMNLAEGRSTATIESKTNFFAKGAGGVLWADCVPVHIGHTTSVWRTRVSRGEAVGDGKCIAEVVQTQLHLDGRGTVEPLAEGEHAEDAPSEEPAGAEIFSLAERRKLQILAGACKVMLAKGFDKASVREIADAAKLPIATMYKYVRSKEEILSLIYENFLLEFQREFEHAMSEAATPEARLEVALRGTIRTWSKYHDQFRLLMRETKSLSKQAREQVYKYDRAYLAKWRKLIEESGAAHRLEIDPELLANLVYYLTTVWPIRHWALGRFTAADVADAIVKFSRAALGEATSNVEARRDGR